jgi:toxin-antitoxin system PIN domain toxin
MFVVDTNLLLYAVNPDAPEHERALALIETWRRGERSWFVTWSIVYEFLRVSTHPNVFPDPLDLEAAQRWIAALLSGKRSGILVETDRHAAVLDEVVAQHPRLRGNLVHDLHIAALMKEHGVLEIRTADADFHQFDFLRVVDPLRGS